MTVDAATRRRMEGLEREALQRHQLARFNELLDRILPQNTFYARKFAHVARPVDSLEAFRELPFTTKEDLVATDSAQGLAANMTWPMERYVRFHQTSGTHGRPLAVFDTAEDWQWWMDCWQYVLDSAGVTAADRAMLAFSFGPFIGFWSAHDALIARGALVIPGGGMNSRARLDLLERTGATVLFCTPTYALHLVEVAEQCKFNLTRSAVEKIVVAGEPGGSIPSVRQRIESAWQARLFDHAGASEVGPWGYADAARRGLHVMESEFIAEFISVETGEPAAAGELSHLVLTTLGRVGMPAIRYRTGDLVRPLWHEDALEKGTGTLSPEEVVNVRADKSRASPLFQRGSNRFVLLEGGVLGRADDMMIIRGVNVFPTAVEQILHSFPEVVEYRMTARKCGAMDELEVEVEDHLGDPRRIAEELYLRLGLRIEVRLAPLASLPRFDGKGRRFVDLRYPIEA